MSSSQKTEVSVLQVSPFTIVQWEEVVSWPPQSGVFLTEAYGLIDPFNSLRVMHHAHLTGVSVRVLEITTPTPTHVTAPLMSAV